MCIRDRSSDGKEYSKLVFSLARNLTEAEAKRFANLSGTLRPYLAQVSSEPDAAPEAAAPGAGVDPFSPDSPACAWKPDLSDWSGAPRPGAPAYLEPEYQPAPEAPSKNPEQQ